MNARASRIADIAASVPDETSRTSSIDGKASMISSASSTSRSVGAPNVVPAAAASRTTSIVSGSAWPKMQRPPRLHPVEQAAPVGGLEIGALAARHEERLVEADAPHCAHGRVDAAGNDLPRPVPERGAHEAHSCDQLANSFAQYVITMSAPARRIEVSDSTAAARSSRSPAAAAAFSIAYSPETL